MPLSTLPPRWRTLLIVSLGVNLLIVGLVAGLLLDSDGPRGPDHDRAEPLVWALPDADRADIRDALPRPDRGERRARFNALLDTLRADPFDPDALREILTRERSLGAQRAARAEDAIIDRLSRMSPEARAAYADRLADRIRHRGRR